MSCKNAAGFGVAKTGSVAIKIIKMRLIGITIQPKHERSYVKKQSPIKKLKFMGAILDRKLRYENKHLRKKLNFWVSY